MKNQDSSPTVFRALPPSRVSLLKRHLPTIEIPVGAAFDIRTRIQPAALKAELQKQFSLVKRRAGKPVAVVFRLREGNAERLKEELSSALAKLWRFRLYRAAWYVVVDPNVSHAEAIRRFDQATGSRGKVKVAAVDAALSSWSKRS